MKLSEMAKMHRQIQVAPIPGDMGKDMRRLNAK